MTPDSSGRSSRPKRDAQRVTFIAAPGSRELYREVAALEGTRMDVWIRRTLHAAAIAALEAHGRDTDHVPAIHLRRPPRLQPRCDEEFDDKGDAS